jgi:hypothetical protein
MSVSTGREWRLTQFKWALQALASSTEEQERLFPQWVIVADELVLDFEHWYSVVRSNQDAELSQQRMDCLQALERFLEQLIPAGINIEPGTWANAALARDPQWTEVRRLAAATLEAFSWPAEPPPRDPGDRGTGFVRSAG